MPDYVYVIYTLQTRSLNLEAVCWGIKWTDHTVMIIKANRPVLIIIITLHGLCVTWKRAEWKNSTKQMDWNDIFEYLFYSRYICIIHHVLIQIQMNIHFPKELCGLRNSISLGMLRIRGIHKGVMQEICFIDFYIGYWTRTLQVTTEGILHKIIKWMYLCIEIHICYFTFIFFFVFAGIVFVATIPNSNHFILWSILKFPTWRHPPPSPLEIGKTNGLTLRTALK